MTIISCIVNGEPRDVPDGQTIAGLLADIGLPEAGIAVAVNERVLPAQQLEATIIVPHMRIEIVRAVGGG